MSITSGITRSLAGIGLVMSLAACGGGGGQASLAVEAPPGTAATLERTASEAQAVVEATLAGGGIVVAKGAGLNSSFIYLGGSPLGGGTSPINWAGAVVGAAREQPLAVVTAPCATVLDATTPPCTGSVRVDSNAPNTPVWPAGTYISMSFEALSGSLGGTAFSMAGAVRIDYLTGIDMSVNPPRNTQIRVTTNNLQGTAEGVSFGPDSGVALLEFDSAGVGSVTVDGVRITGLAGLSATDADNYQLLGVALRAAYGSTAVTYVDTNFDHWTVALARPLLGSIAHVSAGGANAAITVLSSSQATVVYGVVLTVNGIGVSYTVTASYPPPGGGAPTYAVTQPV